MKRTSIGLSTVLTGITLANTALGQTATQVVCAAPDSTNPVIAELVDTGVAMAHLVVTIQNPYEFVSTFGHEIFSPIALPAEQVQAAAEQGIELPPMAEIPEALACMQVDYRTSTMEGYIEYLCASTQFLGAPPYARKSASELEELYKKGVAGVNAGELSAVLAYRTRGSFSIGHTMEVHVKGASGAVKTVADKCTKDTMGQNPNARMGFQID